jgi:AcrR family transcriptional regulator
MDSSDVRIEASAPAKAKLPDRSGRGRPLSHTKHARMLSAATEVFLERGYDAASMDMVALRASVSKATIYSHFAGKRALFGAIIDSLAQRVLVDIGRPDNGVPVEQMLGRIGRTYLDLALATRSLAVHRLVVVEAARAPELGKIIYRNGPERLVAALAAYLERQPALAVPDPQLAAEQFLGMVLGHAQLRLLLGARSSRQARADIDRLVEHAVRIFLHGVPAAGGRPVRRSPVSLAADRYRCSARPLPRPP